MSADSDPREKWLQWIEDYYRDTFPRSMRVKVYNVLPTSQKALSALYDEIISTVSAQYRTVPDKQAVVKALNQVEEAYPELRPEAYNNVPLLEHAPGDTDLGEWFEAYRKAMAKGKNPAESEEVKAVLEKHGVDCGDG